MTDTAGNAQTSLTSSPQSTTVTIADTTAPTVTLAASGATSTSATITFTVTGNEAITCSTLSTASGTDFTYTNISALTGIVQTSSTVCTVTATSSATAGGGSTVSTLTAAASFSMTDTAGNAQTSLTSSPQSTTVTIAAVTTTTAASAPTTTTTTTAAPVPTTTTTTTTTTVPTSTTVSAGQVGIDSWSMVASPNPVRPGQQFVLTTTISCGRQMSTSASPYYPSMYYMVSSSPRLNGVYGGPSLSGDRRTATFSVTLTAPATKGDFNMYAYGRDNPAGSTCTGNSYNFSNSATTRLTVDATPTVTTVAIATTVPTTVATSTSINLLQSLDGPGTLAPLPTTTTQPEIIYSIQAERPVSISPEARSVTVPVSAIQTLFDSISPEDINAARVSMRASDGKWKTVRAVDMKDTNIELSDKSQHIEIQLIIEGKDPIIYNITLNRGAPSSSDNSNLLGALGALLLLGGWLFLVGKRRRQNER